MKYRDLITAEEFEILLADDEILDPEYHHQYGTKLTALGEIRGWAVLAISSGWDFVKLSCIVVCAIGSFGGGIEIINKYGPVTAEAAIKVFNAGLQNCDRVAKQFVLTYPPFDWPRPYRNEFLYIQIPSDEDSLSSSTTTSTTTTTQSPEVDGRAILSGSGLIPFSADWTGCPMV